MWNTPSSSEWDISEGFWVTWVVFFGAVSFDEELLKMPV
jgi:hypothetical protein